MSISFLNTLNKNPIKAVCDREKILDNSKVELCNLVTIHRLRLPNIERFFELWNIFIHPVNTV